MRSMTGTSRLRPADVALGAAIAVIAYTAAVAVAMSAFRAAGPLPDAGTATGASWTWHAARGGFQAYVTGPAGAAWKAEFPFSPEGTVSYSGIVPADGRLELVLPCARNVLLTVGRARLVALAFQDPCGAPPKRVRPAGFAAP